MFQLPFVVSFSLQVPPLRKGFTPFVGAFINASMTRGEHVLHMPVLRVRCTGKCAFPPPKIKIGRRGDRHR